MRTNDLAKLYEDYLWLLVLWRGDYKAAEKYALKMGYPAIVKSALRFTPQMASDFNANRLAKQQELAAMAFHAKAAVDAGTTTDELWAQPLFAISTLVNAWFQTLRSVSLLDALLQDARRVPVGVRVGVTTAFGIGSQVAEAGWTPLTSFEFTADSLLPLKAQALVVLTNELLMFSGQAGASALIGAELQGAAALAADSIVVPLLLAGIAPIPSSGDARTDIREALAGVPIKQISRPHIFTSPNVVKQLAMLGLTDAPPAFPDAQIPGGGSIAGMPLLGLDILSDYQGDGDLLLVVDARQTAGDAGDMAIVVSEQGSIQMNTAPVAGASNLVSLFETHSIGMMATREFVFEKIRTNAVACIKGVNYSPGSPS